MQSKHRRKKCLCCKKWFQPDPRSHPRQHYCSEILCQKWRKAAGQRRWLAREENRDYWSGPDRVKKTQLWFKNNPGGRKPKTNGL
jgi:hypothetical protein